MNGTAVWALRRSASGAPILLLSLPLLGVARLLPENGFGLWLRLVAASLVLLLPGALVARALHLRGASATVTWGLGALGPALLLVFVVHSSILLALAVLGVVGVVALPFALRVVSGPPAWDTLVVAFLGLAFGVALWHVAGVLSGDAFFHLGRVQKLYSFGDLHCRSSTRSATCTSARWTSSPTAGSTRDMPSRSGMRSSPSWPRLAAWGPRT